MLGRVSARNDVIRPGVCTRRPLSRLRVIILNTRIQDAPVRIVWRAADTYPPSGAGEKQYARFIPRKRTHMCIALRLSDDVDVSRGAFVCRLVNWQSLQRAFAGVFFRISLRHDGNARHSRNC